MYTVLFVDDDAALLRANRIYFDRKGFAVHTAQTGAEALCLLKREPVDCIVLDILLPGSDGYQLCGRFRAESSAPILFLTSLTAMDSLYQGFLCGGDDYMTKPYEFRELELRVMARIHQSKGFLKRSELLEFPPLTIDIAGRKVLVENTPVALTSNEFDILVLLARAPDTVFSVSSIYREIWQLPDFETVQTVRVHVGRMRQKLEAACPDHAFIRTVWGKGYLFSSCNAQKKEAE